MVNVSSRIICTSRKEIMLFFILNCKRHVSASTILENLEGSKCSREVNEIKISSTNHRQC